MSVSAVVRAGRCASLEPSLCFYPTFKPLSLFVDSIDVRVAWNSGDELLLCWRCDCEMKGYCCGICTLLGDAFKDFGLDDSSRQVFSCNGALVRLSRVLGLWCLSNASGTTMPVLEDEGKPENGSKAAEKMSGGCDCE